ncbi:unnamed protein product [Cuscuta campestris]|uniref:Uncharacterized protein n=1 Tax=Cuscuta campestris TaxID=132261 RepID=A0A484MDM2_9ASTE|nr:unnamed protein product [Cuscuta campestris]
MAALLGKGFRVHRPDAVGGISLSHNPNPQKYMVMHYHSVENGFRLPLHGLLRDLCLHFGFAPGQLTSNAHKYIASFILHCCALDKTLKLDDFLLLFSVGGFPFYSLYPHNHFPIFEKVELKIDKWSLKYFVIEFPAHSPLDLPESNPAASSSGDRPQGGSTTLVVRNPDAALNVAPISAIPGLRRPTLCQKRPREGLSDDDFLPKKTKGAGTSVSPSPLSNSSGSQNSSSAATPGSLGLELPNPGSLDQKADEHPGQASLTKLAVQPQPDANNSPPQTVSAPLEPEEKAEGQKEPESSLAAEDEVEVLLEAEISHPEDNEAGEQRDAKASPEVRKETEAQQTQEEQREPEERHPTSPPPAVNLPIRRKFTPRTYSAFAEGWEGFSRGLRSLQASHWTIQGYLERMQGLVQERIIPQARPDLLALNALHLMEQAQQSLLTLTEEYLGGASGNFRAVMLLRERELAARALQQKVDSLEQQVQILQGENARLQEDGSTELAAERSKVQSLQDQIANYHKETQDLEVQFGRFQAQISLLESRVSASEDQVGSLKAELVERESRISELENSLQEAKYEGSRLNELSLKHMEARRLDLEKLKGERQAASELRAKVDEQEKMIAAHQEEVATLIARAKALYEEGQFDMQQCIYGAVQSGLPENRTLDEFISYYGQLAAGPSLSDFFVMANKSEGKVVIDLTLSETSSSDDDSSISPAQSNDMAGLSPGEFLRLYPVPRLPAPFPPSPPRLPSGEIDWDSMTLQDFALYQRMCRNKLGRSPPTVEAEPSCESRTTSPNLLKPRSSGSSLKEAAPRPGTWEDYDIGETTDSSTCPLSKRRSPWKGPPPPSC